MGYRSTPISSMTEAFSVKGLNVVITGGNRGIGLGISTAYAQSGANVAIFCRNTDKGNKAVFKGRKVQRRIKDEFRRHKHQVL